MILKKKNLKRNLIYMLFVLFFLLLNNEIFSLPSESFVNLKYVEKEIKAGIDFKWEIDEIVISKNGRQIKIFLNFPYIISDEYQKKIDIPPFSDGGAIFISQYTFEQLVQLLNEEIKQSSEVLQKEIKEQKKQEVAQETVIQPQITKIIDIKEEKKIVVKENSVIKKEPTIEVLPTSTNQIKKQIRILVFDPGHGGNDPGAIGPNGVQEKDIVLDITLRIIKYLKKENFKIYLTRDDDNFISLKGRAIFANEKNADLFISIHCNASRDRGAQGIRTYIYNRVASSREAAEAAKLENKNVGVFEMLLNDLRKSAFEYLSIEAAGNIQHSLVKNLRLKWTPTERAPFYVLANTNMPSVLVEAAFISNPQEEKKLNDNDFREKIAQSISEGIIEYFSRLK